MLSEEDEQLFEAARQAQLNRNTAITLVTNPLTRDAVLNSFVRVLLELPSHQEDYVVARVERTAEGEAYGGFSTVPSQTTRTYLVLHLPRQLAAINGVQYQLNSVSNSGMRKNEFARWLELMRQDGVTDLPTVTDLLQVAAQLRDRSALAAGAPRVRDQAPAPVRLPEIPPVPVIPSMAAVPATNMIQRPSNVVNPAAATAGRPPVNAQTGPVRVPVFSSQQEVLGTALAPRPNTAAPPNMSASPNTPQPVLQTFSGNTARNETEDEKMTRRLRQEVLNHLATEAVLFPRDPTELKLSRLRLTERDVLEYLQHIHDEVANKQENCVVCMDHVPTVILLPCKHKVMCRLCATSVAVCPVCRSPIKEMFEAEEI